MLTDSLPLKRGMLHYAYSRKMTVQCIICANKEAVLSEKYQVARWGQTVWAGYSDPINAADFDSFEAFMTTVQSTWDTLWKEVYGADPAGRWILGRRGKGSYMGAHLPANILGLSPCLLMRTLLRHPPTHSTHVPPPTPHARSAGPGDGRPGA